MKAVPRTAERLAAQEPIAFGHEHAQALGAARLLEERLEILGPTHERDRQLVKALSRSLANDLHSGRCDAEHEARA